MSSFTEARFEPVVINGKPFKKEGRQIYAVRGQHGDGFWFHIGYVGSGLAVHVKEGFLTDGGSRPTPQSPGLLMKLIGVVALVIPKSVMEKAMLAFGLHDYLCEHPKFSRPDADGQFWVALNALEVPPFWRDIFFKAVTTNKNKEQINEWNGAEGQDGAGHQDLFGDGGRG